MYDPLTVAHEIKSPFKSKDRTFRNTLITIWHKDPCSDGTDDSCGWFMRVRHCDKNVFEKIKREFNFNFKHNYWFDKKGKQVFSTIGTLIQMYNTATWIYFKQNRKKQKRFMKKYLLDIINFAENPTDCGGDSITNKFNDKTEERFNGLASMIYSDICRRERKWYKHPKWHIHHWRFQFDFIQQWLRNNKR